MARLSPSFGLSQPQFKRGIARTSGRKLIRPWNIHARDVGARPVLRYGLCNSIRKFVVIKPMSLCLFLPKFDFDRERPLLMRIAVNSKNREQVS